MNPAQVYSFKVWLTMVIFAPAIQMSAGQIFFNTGDPLSLNFIRHYPLSVLVLLVATAPLGALLTYSISKMDVSIGVPALKQRVTIAVGVAAILIFAGASIPDSGYSVLRLICAIVPYPLSLILGIWICVLDTEATEEEEYEETAS
ncbi:MAG TPA: hypothetical protein VIM77_08035 [Mucilaginibacter sp.]